jgi:hypothetical protein
MANVTDGAGAAGASGASAIKHWHLLVAASDTGPDYLGSGGRSTANFTMTFAPTVPASGGGLAVHGRFPGAVALAAEGFRRHSRMKKVLNVSLFCTAPSLIVGLSAVSLVFSH